MSQAPETLSFVIPTFNRAATLRRCLLALNREWEVNDCFEVIVVDDGSSDGTSTMLWEIGQSVGFPLTTLGQQNRGPAAARNLGVKKSSGHWLAFIGDDIVVNDSYVDALSRGLQLISGRGSGILGLTYYAPSCVHTPFARWVASGDFQFAYRTLETGKPVPFTTMYSSNLLLRREAFDEAGGFDERLDQAAFEDTELGYRLWKLGHEVAYWPAASAEHWHEVSVKQTRGRMQAMAHALLQLREVNPELFDALYPNAEEVFGKPKIRRQFARRLFAGPLTSALEAADLRSVPLPGALYAGCMRATFSNCVARRWKGPVS